MGDVDFGRHSEDYARHRPGFPASFFDRIGPLRGLRALDLGTGPGTVALELARRGADVLGIDVSRGQIEAAGRGRFAVARAESVPAPDGAFDLVTAGQCWVWFDHDAALGEARRVLRPGGRLVVAHYCYLPQRSAVARETEALILKHNPAWTMAGHSGVYPEYVDSLQRQEFELVEQFCYDHAQQFTHDGWRGRMRTCNGIGSGPLSEAQVEAFDRELAQMLRRDHPKDPMTVWHRVWAVVVRKPSPTPQIVGLFVG